MKSKVFDCSPLPLFYFDTAIMINILYKGNYFLFIIIFCIMTVGNEGELND